MKSKFALLIALFSLFVFAGCMTSEKLNQIAVGMSKQQVLTVLGTPDSVSAQANVEYLTYYLSTASSGWSSNYYNDQPYSIRLVDGKVESFGRFRQLMDMYYRPVGSSPMGVAGVGMGMSYGYPTTVVQQPSQGTQTQHVNLAAELQKLVILRQQGVLNEDEFQKAKQKLLATPTITN